MISILLFGLIITIFLILLLVLLLTEEDNTEKNIEEKPKQIYNWEKHYPTKCEKCNKVDNYVTKPNMRFCNSCHIDYIMID
jgi:hypothetical protein